MPVQTRKGRIRIIGSRLADVPDVPDAARGYKPATGVEEADPILFNTSRPNEFTQRRADARETLPQRVGDLHLPVHFGSNGSNRIVTSMKRRDTTATIGEERDSINTVDKPFFNRQGFLQRRPRDCAAAPLAYQHHGVAPPKHAGGLFGAAGRGMAALARTCKRLIRGLLAVALFAAWGVVQALTPTFRSKVHVVPTVTLKQAQLLAGELAASVPATIGGELRLPFGTTARLPAVILLRGDAGAVPAPMPRSRFTPVRITP